MIIIVILILVVHLYFIRTAFYLAKEEADLKADEETYGKADYYIQFLIKFMIALFKRLIIFYLATFILVVLYVELIAS